MGFMDFLDLSYILLNSLRNVKFRMKGIALSISNEGFTLIIDGYCLKYIEYNSKENTLKLESPPVSLIDLIDELHPSDYDVDEVLKGDWLDAKFISKMIKKYPKAFESYLAEKKAVDELARKYGLNFKLIVDSEGQMSAQLLWRNVEPNIYKINELISEGLAAFEEKCSILGHPSLEELYFKRNLQLIELILNYLDIVKDLYIQIKGTEINIGKVEVSNSVDALSLIKPKVEILLDMFSGDGLGIIISEEKKIKLKLVFYSKHIREGLMEFLNKDGFFLEKKDPVVYTKGFSSVREGYEWIKDKLLSQIL